ncbi:MAG TPA: hypothetical protein VKT31_13515 [Solirubrobacteraceae bacterium]|nr:hypothetical protein [Solirubrobacteraceae bacterium]
MSFGQYALGLVLATVCVGSVALGARRLRARLIPGAAGSLAWVADGVIVAALLVLVSEATGILGVFDRVGTTIGCVAAGGACWLAGASPQEGRRDPRARTGIAAAVAVAIIAAPWLAWTAYAYRHGMESVDTLWYHLPAAARFVQLGSVVHLQYFDRDPVTVFYPADSELLHGLGLIWFRSDVLSPLVNLGWAALAGAAAWALGRRDGRSLGCLLGALIVIGTPGLVDTQPGGAYNDIACIALVLAAIALLGSEETKLWYGSSLLAASAAGLALGTKLTMVVPAVALAAAAVILAAPRHRLRSAGIWVASLLVLGGFWYGRNWVAAGNPLPSVAIQLGPISLPAPHVSTPTFTVAQYLANGHVWHLFFIPGLRRSLGLAWWALLAGGIGGSAGALVLGRGRAARLSGAVGLVSVIAFLFTPQFLGLPGVPLFFVANVRYVDSALVIGLVLLPLLPIFRARRALMLVTGAMLIVLLLTELDPGVWPDGLRLAPFSPAIHGSSAIVGVVAAAVIACVYLVAARVPAGAGWLAAAVLLVAGGFPVARAYAQHRFLNTPPLPRIFAWAQHERHQRIAVVGIDLQYPLYGPDESNYVQYLGARAPHAGYRPFATCQAWRQAVNGGHYRWLLITPFGFPFGTAATVAPEARWTELSPAARLVLRERTPGGEAALLYELSGPLDPGACTRRR